MTPRKGAVVPAPCEQPGCDFDADPESVQYCVFHAQVHVEVDAGKGVKLDDDPRKLRYDLIPHEAEAEVASVLTYGSFKYDADNWRKVPDAVRRYRRALLGHVQAWRGGEQYDRDTGESHLAHAICCAMFLLVLEKSSTPRVPRWLTELLAKRAGLLPKPGLKKAKR